MNKLNNHLFFISILLLLFFTFSFLYKSDSSFDQDLGRHLKLGEIISKTSVVPKTNLFSYTYPNFPFINHHYLFEVFVYQWSQIFNLESLLIIKILVILISISLTFLIIDRKYAIFLLPIGYIFLHVLRERTDLRPEIFSFLFTALTLFILEKFYIDKKSKLIFFLPIIQLLWINIHIYFFVGIILQIIYLSNFLLEKKFRASKTLLIAFILSILFSLLNPNSINALIYPFTVFSNYGYTIAENQNMFLLENIGFVDSNFLFVKLSIFIILISFILSLLRNTFSIKNNSICAFGLILAMINIRSFPYLVFLSLPFVLKNLNFENLSKKLIFIIILTGILIIFESFSYLSGDYYKKLDKSETPGLSLMENGKNAMDFVISKDLPTPIYNNFDIGSYILYWGFPKYKVFVDGRPEAYPVNFFTNKYIPSQSDFNNFKKLEEEYKFKTIIFSITDQTPWGVNFLDSIVKDGSWNTVYIDDFIIILVKKDLSIEMKLPLINLNSLNPNSYNFQNHVSYLRIAYFLLRVGNLESSKLFVKKALEIYPDSRIANSMFVYFISNSNNPYDKLDLPIYLKKAEKNILW